MRRPWNMVNSPVYALLTRDGEEFNANICTYVMSASRKPKLYVIALEHHSKTLNLLERNPRAVLQMLTQQQIMLVAPLGKKSGFRFSKMDYLENKYGLSNWRGWPAIRDTAANLLLETVNQITTGDHELFTMKVIHFQTLQRGDILMFNHLIEERIILN